jgi:hypothetical protein
VGFFGTYLYDGHRWSGWTLGNQPDIAEPWLLLDIHDSDIASLFYQPTGVGSGTAFLGVTPRVYFGDDSSSGPTDRHREAEGLTTWWELVHGRLVEPADRAAMVAQIEAYLADDAEPDLDLNDDDLDDAEVFVEIKAGRFLTALGLPVPDDLPRR